MVVGFVVGYLLGMLVTLAFVFRDVKEVMKNGKEMAESNLEIIDLALKVLDKEATKEERSRLFSKVLH